MTSIARRTFIKATLGGAAAAALPLSIPEALAQPLPAGDWSSRKQRTRVRGLNMAWYEAGEGDPIVFLHGNPTSSYLWRNVIPHIQHLGRCIAPDLIGMGDSDPLPQSGPGAYKFSVHRDYIFDLLDTLGVTDNVTLVIHDWGSGIGLSYGQRWPQRIKGIAYMEAILNPEGLPPVPEPTQGAFAIFRSPAGEEAVLQNNMFIEQILIGGLGYYLTEEDKAEYRRPFLTPGESRRPTLTWPRELPRGGNPADTSELVRSYTTWFAQSDVPKLFVRVNPGAILSSPELLAFVRGFANQQEVTVFGSHYVQEISPHAIGRAIAQWLPTV